MLSNMHLNYAMSNKTLALLNRVKRQAIFFSNFGLKICVHTHIGTRRDLYLYVFQFLAKKNVFLPFFAADV